jgi:hypothetical protein
MASSQIPYATEHGISKRVSGNFFQGTGNFHLARARTGPAPIERSHPRRGMVAGLGEAFAHRRLSETVAKRGAARKVERPGERIGHRIRLSRAGQTARHQRVFSTGDQRTRVGQLLLLAMLGHAGPIRISPIVIRHPAAVAEGGRACRADRIGCGSCGGRSHPEG